MSNNQYQTPEKQYINSLNEIETKAYNIAVSKLGSSFSVEKSVGFIKWNSKNNNIIPVVTVAKTDVTADNAVDSQVVKER